MFNVRTILEEEGVKIIIKKCTAKLNLFLPNLLYVDYLLFYYRYYITSHLYHHMT
jgi:hypothetical protein